MIGSLLVASLLGRVAAQPRADEGGNNLPITVLLVVLAIIVLAVVLVVVRRARRAALTSSRSSARSNDRPTIS